MINVYKQLAFLFCLLIFISSKAQTVNDTINAQELESYVSFLASDSMKGRSNRGDELFACATYIGNEFEKFVLKKSANLKSFF